MAGVADGHTGRGLGEGAVKNTQLANSAVNAEANALGALLNMGFLDLFDGVQPATADTPIGTQNVLASIRFGDTAFAPAVDGMLVAEPLTACSSANAKGFATWARCFAADHKTAVLDMTVGARDADILMDDPKIYAGSVVGIAEFVYSIPKAKGT